MKREKMSYPFNRDIDSFIFAAMIDNSLIIIEI